MDTADPSLDKSLKACIKEGVTAQVMIGIFDYYLIPFALYLQATTQQIGFLVSVPHFLSSASQFFVTQAVAMAGGRKALLCKAVLLQALLLVPIPFLVFTEFTHRILALICLISIFRFIGAMIGPAWGSMVSGYLPENLRGQFFGRRSQIIGLVGLAALGFWGFFLTQMNAISAKMGFFIIFMAAALCRFASYAYIRQMTEGPVTVTQDDHFTFWMFIRRVRESNFVRFILYVASITFATQLSAAYFSVYMLEHLGFNYWSYTSVHLAWVIAGLLTFPIWGRHADIAGNAKIIKITSWLIPLIPVFWIFARHPFQLVMIEFFSGFVWAGFNLCSANYIYDAVSPPKRVRCLGYFNLINSMAIFLGASLGGWLSGRLPPVNGSPLVTLFIVSAVFRLAAHFLLSRRFHEVRTSFHKTRSMELFLSVLGVRPLTGPNVESGIFPLIRRLNRSLARFR